MQHILMFKQTIFLLFLLSIPCLAQVPLSDFKYQYWNIDTNKPDGYADKVSSATYATNIAPQNTYYFNSDKDTYFTYDNNGMVSLYIRNVLIVSWLQSKILQNLVRNGQNLLRGGQQLKR